MGKKIKILILSLTVFGVGCVKTNFIIFKVSTNFIEGKSHLVRIDSITKSNSKINIYFLKKYYHEFHGLPNNLINKNLKNQEVAEWEFKNKSETYLENWKEIYTYDSVGRLIEYKYSSCKICSQMPWGYKLIYNNNNDVVEQQVYGLKQTYFLKENEPQIKYEFEDSFDYKIELMYDKSGNIIGLKKIGNEGLEKLIELVD